jgi:hypothetical protein
VIAALTPIRVEAGFWLILLLGLVAGIGFETDWGRQLEWPMTEITEAAPDFAKPELVEPFRLAPPDQFLEVTTRPIFIVTRRPAPPAPAVEAARPSMQKGQFVLVGTSIVGATKIAFLLEKAGNKNRVVSEGKEINGIKVEEIVADRIVLSQFGDKEVLVMRSSRDTPPGGRGVPGMPLPGQRGPNVAPQPQAPAPSGAIGPGSTMPQPADTVR